MSDDIVEDIRRNYRRITFVLLGIFLLLLFSYMPSLPPAVAPDGKVVQLNESGQRAIGLFLLAGAWWVFEVIPIGATALAIGFLQPLFNIRTPSEAFKDFTDPSVMFILGSLIFGIAFAKVGLTKRLAYKMLLVVGEKTKFVLLGTMIMTALLTHFMAHTAAAAIMFPVLITVVELYGEGNRPTKFGKALFIGMAFAAGAGSMCTVLGGARNPIALGMFEKFTGKVIGFADFSKITMPLGWTLVFVFWLALFLMFRPEKDRILGLKEKAKELNSKMGPITLKEIFVLAVLIGAMAIWIKPTLIFADSKFYHLSVVSIAAATLFFLTRILDVKDLEKSVPWNIVLLFGGAMSIGFALWNTGAAEWIAINWLTLFKGAHWLIFVIAIAFLVMVMTNFIMNVAAIAITLPVALIMAKYLGVNEELILFVSVVTAALPLVLLIGAAPNAIAYESRQFKTGEFFVAGIPTSIVTLIILAIFTVTVWVLLGLSPLTGK